MRKLTLLRAIIPMLSVLCMPVSVFAKTNTERFLETFGITPENAAIHQGIEEVSDLIQMVCLQVYPRPSPTECIDRIKHGIGASFDPHSDYMNAAEFKLFREGSAGAFGGIGIEISKIVSAAPVTVMNVMEDTPSYRAGLLAGDVITHIVQPGGKSIPTTSIKDVTEVVKLLRGTPDSPVTLNVMRKGSDNPLTFTLKREVINVVQIKGELIDSGGKLYALIENKQFSEHNHNALRTKFEELERKAGRKLSGLILRLENNPGGLLDEAYADVDLFLDAQNIVLIRSNESIDPYVPPNLANFRTPGDITKGLPILVVVNGGSASASEVFAGAMKHFGRAVIAGTSRTFGKGIVQTVYHFTETEAVKLTSSEYLIGTKTDWIPVQCSGVEPDILFEYPGIKNTPRPTECEMSGHVNSAGVMQNAPVHADIKVANPGLYKAGEAMLEVYKAHMTPKLLVEKEKFKKLQDQQ